jgi:DNA-binding CsgD family transcriptional regulator
MVSTIDAPAPLLYERDRELSALARHRSELGRGSGGILSIRGEPGTGKSALLARAVAAARPEGFLVCAVRGAEFEQSWAFGVARQVLGALLRQASDLDAVLAGAGRIATRLLEPPLATAPPDASFALMHGLYWACVNASAQAPVLLAIDDAHWVDEPSLRALAFIAGRLPEHPIGVLLTARRGDTSPPALAALLGERHATSLCLEPLSADAIAAITRERFGADPAATFVRACQRVTGGNPLYLRELHAALLAEHVPPTATAAARVAQIVPRGVTDALLLRLAQLGTVALEVARGLAVLGDGSHTEDLAALAGVTGDEAGDALDTLARAGIVASSDGPRFTHPIIRAAVYGELTPFAQARRHGRAAEILHVAGRPDAIVAAQLRRSGPVGTPWAIETLMREAAATAARGAPDLAAQLIARALEEQAPIAERAALELELGRMLAAVDPMRSLEHFDTAARLSPDATVRGDAAVGRAMTLIAANHADQAVKVVTDVRPQLGADQREQAMQLDALALAIAPTATASGRREADALRADSPGARGLLASLAFRRAIVGEPAEVVLPLARRALAQGASLAAQGIDLFLTTTFVLILGDQFDDALTCLNASLRDAQTHGSLLWFISASSARSFLHYRAGSLPDAEADARQALDAADARMPFWVVQAAAPLALTLCAAGRPAEAQEPVARAASRLTGGAALHQYALLDDARGAIAYAQGRFADAARAFLAAGDVLSQLGERNPAAFDWRSQAALASARIGDRERAHELAAEEVALARAFGAPRAIGVALRRQALVTEPVSVDQLREALDVLAGSPARLEHARALVDYGAALRRTGQRATAREPLTEGLDLAARCGAAPLIARAHEELLAAGARPRRQLRHGVDALTASERRIAQLAADGLSNPEIAQSLFLSPRTVESHLGHVYRKLNIAHREQLPSVLGADNR